MHQGTRRVLALAAGLLMATVHAWAQVQFKAVTDTISYNVGSTVRLRIVSSPNAPSPAYEFVATLRYAGNQKPVLDRVPLGALDGHSSSGTADGYRDFWRVPTEARTGLYEVAVEARDAKSHQVISTTAVAASFVVHQKLVQIEAFKLGKAFYTSGDAVACALTLKNLSNRPLTGLRVEFSDRYWPWIGPTGGSTDLHIILLSRSLSLIPRGRADLSSPRAATAETVKQPTVHQYAVIVWDQTRSKVYDIAFSPLTLVQLPGVDSPKPYPAQYAHGDLGGLKFESYRHFYPVTLDSPAIHFDRSHTMWPAGSEATISFSVVNPTAKSWRSVSIRARLAGPRGAEVASTTVAEKADIEARAAPLNKSVAFALPVQPGIYRAVAEIVGASGEVLAENSLEMAVNPLPQSILVFCAHEDDEGGHSGLYRAAVENHIPIRFLYYTSGNAGSCDRYYQHSCSPAESLNFGTIRVEEVRGALGHLGVPRENIYFVGLPDGGSGEIWYKHPQSADPFLDLLLATDHAPYEGLVQPNLPYARDCVVELTKEFIRKFQPDVIYTAHPGDVRHVDHIVANYFVVKALQQLLREKAVAPNLTLLVDEVHDAKLQPVTPYRYQKYVLNVSGEAKALAQEAGWYHQSQGGNRGEENRKAFDQLSRTENFREVLDWQEHEGWNERKE